MRREKKLDLENHHIMDSEALKTMKDTIVDTNACGTVMGYYDEGLTIFSVSDYLLDNLGYTFEEFAEVTRGSLKNICCDKRKEWMDTECFRKQQGVMKGKIFVGDGTPSAIRAYKMDSKDEKGNILWVLYMQVDWEYENYTLINEAIKSGSWYMDCDRDGNVVHVSWSDTFRKMLGYQDTTDFPDVMESWSDLLHPTDHDRVVSRLHEAILDQSNQTKYHIDYRLKVRDGSYHWYRAIGEIVRRYDGSAHRIAGVFVNIDREKETLMQIQRSNAFHHAFTRANLCEYYVDLQHDSFESLKIESSLLTSLEQKVTSWDELIQEFIYDYVCEDDKKAVEHFYDRNEITKKLNEFHGELSLECKVEIEGKISWIRNVIMRGEEKGTQYVIVFLRDITEAKEENIRKKKLLDDNSAMEHLVRSMIHVVDHFAICDLEHNKYQYYNINLEQKYPPTGLYSDFVRDVTSNLKLLQNGRKLVDLLSPENLRKELIDENEIYKFEYCSLEEDVFRIASFVPLEWENGMLSKVLWISIDVTDEKKMEIESRKALKDAFLAAEHANKAKTEFLTNMSHDIRTPMNAIVGLTALAGANIDNQERVIGCLSKITSSSRHLLSLINEVLDMAKIESGKISLMEEDFDLSDLIDNLIHMVKPNMEEHGHKFRVQISDIEHEAVYGDSLRIQQIFTNLMSNAIKYTPDGGNIKLSIKEKANGFSELGCFECCIEDDGIGMTKEFQEVMFQPFTRADDHRTTNIQGTGLGMAITQNIVHMMNGDIKVESELNKGTKVTVTIYLKLQKKEAAKIKELMNLPVLVVDDDSVSCKSTVAVLEEIGIIGEWVTSGKDAIKYTLERHERKEDYFAIIMDWKMPGMDGIEATRKIRKQVGSDVTIIVLIAYDYSEIEMEARAAGVDAFIAKPLFPSKLTATLQKLITGQSEKADKNDITTIKHSNHAGKRILLVEDNDLNREIAMEIISMTKAEVEEATNGKEAVEKVAFSPEGWYDLVLMDIQMPVMNGYEATAAIRGLKGKRGKIPIIATTANAFAEDVQMAKNTGMNGHLAKPLELGKLNETLNKWLS